MIVMTKLKNVLLRGNIYHFRMMVPADLQECYGRTTHTQSLKTADPLDASKKADILTAKYKEEHQKLRETMKMGTSVATPQPKQTNGPSFDLSFFEHELRHSYGDLTELRKGALEQLYSCSESAINLLKDISKSDLSVEDLDQPYLDPLSPKTVLELCMQAIGGQDLSDGSLRRKTARFVIPRARAILKDLINEIAPLIGNRAVYTDPQSALALPKTSASSDAGNNREINVGYDLYSKEKSHEAMNPRMYSINSFTLPACEKCNTHFSALEGETKPIVIKLLGNEPINSVEISKLLDWLDKVRVGLWLMFYTLDKNPRGISPQFHIKNRIAQHDRMLHLSINKRMEKRVNFVGVQTPSFHMTPSVFGLVINNIAIINISSLGLLSRRMGFPFIRSISLEVNEQGFVASVKMDKDGLQRVMRPVLKAPVWLKGVSFYQAVYGTALIPTVEGAVTPDEHKKIFDLQYVKENSLAEGASKIISTVSGSMFLSASEDISLSNHYDVLPKKLASDFGNQVIQLQMWLDKEWIENIDLSTLSSGEKRYIKKNYRVNESISKRLLDQ